MSSSTVCWASKYQSSFSLNILSKLNIFLFWMCQTILCFFIIILLYTTPIKNIVCFLWGFQINLTLSYLGENVHSPTMYLFFILFHLGYRYIWTYHNVFYMRKVKEEPMLKVTCEETLNQLEWIQFTHITHSSPLTIQYNLSAYMAIGECLDDIISLNFY